MTEDSTATFTGLVDLALSSLGGRVLGTSDEFFAPATNLLLPGRAAFLAGKFTDRGKWMDGWESRRKRTSGHDWCILELGAAGDVLGFDIDTRHFVGNHPPFASVDGVLAPAGASLSELTDASWTELLPQVALAPNAQNLLVATAAFPVRYLRLNIFPDGGVARFRAFGKVRPEWGRAELDQPAAEHVLSEWVDLGALKNGALPLACSDAHFGPMHHLLSPGRAENMGGGWETRRKRAAGQDWVLIRLAARGTIYAVEVDTAHFKGNYPDRCSIETIDAPGARTTDLIESRGFLTLLPEAKLSADTRHFFREELSSPLPASHVRLNIFPDGGVSRLRLWGTRNE